MKTGTIMKHVIALKYTVRVRKLSHKKKERGVNIMGMKQVRNMVLRCEGIVQPMQTFERRGIYQRGIYLIENAHHLSYINIIRPD